MCKCGHDLFDHNYHDNEKCFECPCKKYDDEWLEPPAKEEVK